MTQDALFSPSPVTRRPPKEKRRVGEVAGGAAAECAAVCCCCPCSVMNLLILAVYKVPKGLCMKAWAAHNKKRRRCTAAKKKGLLQPRPDGSTGGRIFSDDGDGKVGGVGEEEKKGDGKEEGEELLEKEMWDRFYGAGFWRSASRREM